MLHFVCVVRSTEDSRFDLGIMGSIPCHRADLVENKHTDHVKKRKSLSLHLSLYAGRLVFAVHCIAVLKTRLCTALTG